MDVGINYRQYEVNQESNFARIFAVGIIGGLLAGAAALAARYAKNISLSALLGVIISYQIVGTAFEWALCDNFFLAVQDFRMGIPGMLIQWFGGYALLKAIARI